MNFTDRIKKEQLYEKAKTAYQNAIRLRGLSKINIGNKYINSIIAEKKEKAEAKKDVSNFSAAVTKIAENVGYQVLSFSNAVSYVGLGLNPFRPIKIKNEMTEKIKKILNDVLECIAKKEAEAKAAEAKVAEEKIVEENKYDTNQETEIIEEPQKININSIASENIGAEINDAFEQSEQEKTDYPLEGQDNNTINTENKAEEKVESEEETTLFEVNEETNNNEGTLFEINEEAQEKGEDGLEIPNFSFENEEKLEKGESSLQPSANANLFIKVDDIKDEASKEEREEIQIPFERDEKEEIKATEEEKETENNEIEKVEEYKESDRLSSLTKFKEALAKYKDLQDKNLNLAERTKEIAERIDQENESLQAAQVKLDEKLQALNSRYEEEQAKTSSLEAEIAQKENDLSSIENQIKEYNEILDFDFMNQINESINGKSKS